MRVIYLLAAALAVAATLAFPAKPALAQGQTADVAAGILDCNRFFNLKDFRSRKLEVCYAYIVGDVDLALVPYLSFGTTTNYDLNKPLVELMRYGFRGKARQRIVRRVINWPGGIKRVDHSIKLVSAHPVERRNRATLITRESWSIKTLSGRQLEPSEHNCQHRVFLRRVPGVSRKVFMRFLHRKVGFHKWAVYKVQNLGGRCW